MVLSYDSSLIKLLEYVSEFAKRSRKKEKDIVNLLQSNSGIVHKI